MAQFKLSPFQVTTLHDAIHFLDDFGSPHSTESVFAEYTFYRRQDEAARQAEALEQLVDTLTDVQARLGTAAAEAETPELTNNANTLQKQVKFIGTAMKSMLARHKARALAGRAARAIFGGSKGA